MKKKKTSGPVVRFYTHKSPEALLCKTHWFHFTGAVTRFALAFDPHQTVPSQCSGRPRTELSFYLKAKFNQVLSVQTPLSSAVPQTVLFRGFLHKIT